MYNEGRMCDVCNGKGWKGGGPRNHDVLDDKEGGGTSSYIILSQCFLIFNQV